MDCASVYRYGLFRVEDCVTGILSLCGMCFSLDSAVG